MANVLISWVGGTDLKAPKEEKSVGKGPLAQALRERSFESANLISDYQREDVEPFVDWLRTQAEARITVTYATLSSPTSFGEIYEVAVRVVDKVLEIHEKEASLCFHLSPGTPAMAAVWIILAKTRFPAELIESSALYGVRTASVPFDISAEFIPDLLRGSDKRLKELSAALPPETPEFADIIHRSREMERVITKARFVAPRSVPVLIEGESGTGKELLARAIHSSSPRREKLFLPINCGAIPSELVESHFFGHEKGGFTGATQRRIGFFEAADGGTLFLDEIGELPLDAQVKLLRILEDGIVVRIGSTELKKVDVRVLAATNRQLMSEMATGKFREDLFYRLAVAVLRLPPLRERAGDKGLLIDFFLNQINCDSAIEPSYQYKTLSSGAKNILLQHSWPGNVRELINTLRRAALWSTGGKIEREDVLEAIFPKADTGDTEVLNRPLGDGIDLRGILSQVVRHYIGRALAETKGNKTRAARLVGLKNYQTLAAWMEKHGVEE